MEFKKNEAKRIISLNDRYAVYRLIGRSVEFSEYEMRVKGIVDKVLRNVFDDTISIWIRGEENVFDEPSLMYLEGNTLVFIYGHPERVEMDDEELFSEMDGAGYSGETVEDVLRRTRRGTVTEVCFEIKNGKDVA